MLKMGSLFDGIGGFPLAAVRAGIRPVWASEIEAFPIEVTKHRFPGMIHVGDITRLDGANLPPVDVICGGSPCQDLSIAGARAGLTGSRSGLFMEQIRIVKEMRNADRQRGRTGIAVRPRWMCWENVPGAFSSGIAKGEDFRIVLEEIVRIKRDPVYVPGPYPWTWQPAGRILLGDDFSLAWRVLDAQYWPRTPQRRRRIFLVADFAGQSAPQILFKQDSLPGYPAQGAGAWEGIAAPAESGADGPGGPFLLTAPRNAPIAFAANQRDEIRDLHNAAGALSAQPGIKQQTFIAQGCLTPWDTQQARIFTPNSKAPTLAGADGGGGRNPAGLLFAAGFCAGAGPAAGSVGYQEEVSPTLKASPSGNMMPSVLCLNDQGGGVMECSRDISGTLRAQPWGPPPQPSGSGCGGERRSSEMSEPCRLRQGEGYGACDDDGHQPLVFDNHGQDSRFRGPVGIAQTVSASFGEGGNNQPLVIGPRGEESSPVVELFENHGIDARYTGPHSVSPTITARAGTGGCNLPLALQTETGRVFGGGMEYQTDIVDTLTAADQHAVYSRQRSDKFVDTAVASTESARQRKDATDLICQTAYQKTVGALTSSDRKGPNNQYVGQDKLVVEGPLLIRRLTPLECERLQGFPDFWTDLPGASDSARYRALGNSVAIPCVEYIMRGIAMAADP